MRAAAQRKAAVGPGLALALLHLVLGLLLYDPALFPGGDNAGYMILGKALASGQGYRDLYLPTEPLHTKYPPLYPILLAVLTPLGGLQLFKLVSLALTSLAVWLTYRLARERVGSGYALVAAGLFAVSPVLLDYSHYVLSEALFVVLVVWALLWTERPAPDAPVEPTRGAVASRALILGMAAAAGAFLTRTAGLPLLAALVLFFLLERKPRPALAASLIAAVTAGGWWVYQRLASSSGVRQPSYLGEMLLRNPYDPAAGSAGPADLLMRATDNAWTYVSDVLPRALTGSISTGPASAPLHTALGMAVTALACFGWAKRSTTRLGPPELFAVLYSAMLALWPPVWTDQRFLLPLLPLVLIYASAGAAAAGRRLSRRPEGRLGPRVAVGGLAAVVGIGAAGHAIALIPDRIRCLAEYRAGATCDPPEFGSFYAAADWARANTADDAVFVNRKPRIFFWISDRRGDLYPYSTDPRVVLRAIERMGADYVVVDAISGTTSRYLVPALRERPSEFEVVYEGGDPPTFVLRFHPEPAAAD